jgi:hypothetical protein
MYILALDPGKINFAYAVLDGELKETGVLTPPELVADIPKFVNEQIRPLLVKGGDQKTAVVIERYMFRGQSSVHAEKVNLIIGGTQLLLHQLGIECCLITASQWKKTLTGHIKRIDPERKASRICSWWWFLDPEGKPLKTEHEADAIGMAWYYAKTYDPKATVRCVI